MRAANCMRDYGTTNNTPAHQAPPVWRAPEGLEDPTAAQVGGGRACQHTNNKPDRLEAAARPAGPGRASHRHPDRLEAAVRPAGPGRGAGGRRQGLVGLRDDAPSAARGADGERAGRCPPAHTAARPNKTGHAAAGPGRASRRHAEPIISTPGSTGVEDTGGNCRGAGGRRQGLAGLREDTPSQSSAHPAPLVWRTPEGPAAVLVGGGRAWPGFEIDHSERSSRVAISRAGRRPPAPTRRHKHSATNT